jgi:hypothetical protein
MDGRHLGLVVADPGHGRDGAAASQGQALHHARRRSLHCYSKPSLMNSNTISLNPAPGGFGLKLGHCFSPPQLNYCLRERVTKKMHNAYTLHQVRSIQTWHHER